MKKAFWLIALTTVYFNTVAQDLASISLNEIGPYKKAHTTYLVKESDGYIYTLGSNKSNHFLSETCKVIYLRKYSLENIEDVKEWAFENNDLGNGEIYLKHFSVGQNHINALLEVYRKKEKVKELFAKQFSLDGELLKVKKLFSVPSSKGISRRFLYYRSPDLSMTMVYADVNTLVETEKTPLVAVFDKNLEVLFLKSPRFSTAENSVMKPVGMAVSNVGEAYVLGFSGSKKGVKNDGFITNQYAICRMAENEEIIDYYLDNDKIRLHGAALGFSPEGNLILNGLYSLIGQQKIDGNLYYLLDNEDLSEIKVTQSSFEDRLQEKLNHYSGLMYSAFHFYEFSEIIHFAGGSALIAEQYYQSGSDNTPNAVVTKRAYFVIMLDKEGSLNQIVPIELNQSIAEGIDNYLFTVLNNKILLLFNDHHANIINQQENKKMIDPFGLAFGGMSIQLVSIGLDGQTAYQVLLKKESFGKVPALITEHFLINDQEKIFGYISEGMNIFYLAEITLK